MGAGCSTAAVGDTEQSGFPPRPVYQVCDLVGPAVFEKVQLGDIDGFYEHAAQFAQGLCDLNDALSGSLLDVRLATGLLQGGITTALSPSPNVDIFSVELLTVEGRPLDVAEAGRLRGRDLAVHGNLAACDTQLARCVEELVSYFVRNAGTKTAALALSAAGTLEPRTPGQKLDPAVEAFNHAMLDMRAALGSDYLLALHLHKAQAHGAQAFRVRLLKPTSIPSLPSAPPLGSAEAQTRPNAPLPTSPTTLPYTYQPLQPLSQQPLLYPTPAAAAYPTAAYPTASPPYPTSAAAAAFPAAAPAAAAAYPATPAAAPAAAAGWEAVSVLEQAACLNSSALHDALHAYHDANGRLAAAAKAAGLTCSGALVLSSPRYIRLAGAAPPAASSTSIAAAAASSNPAPSFTAATPAASFGAQFHPTVPSGHSASRSVLYPASPASPSSASTTANHHRHQHHHRQHHHHNRSPAAAAAASAFAAAAAAVPSKPPSYPSTTSTSAAAAAAAAAVRSLPPPARARLSYAVAALNTAAHRLASASAAAAGPASFAALLTHVLGELRELVAREGGDQALESYRPAVRFTRGGAAATPASGLPASAGPAAAVSAPSPHPLTISLTLEPRLGDLAAPGWGAAGASWGGAGGEALQGAAGGGRSSGGGGGGGRQLLPPFPDCLSPPVRGAWLLLQELIRAHNAAVSQLGPLGQMVEALEEGGRLRLASVSADAAAARLPARRAAQAEAAAARNLAELRACCRGALQSLLATAGVVADEVAEAAQLATVQCAFMSPLAWSVSVASSLEGLAAAAAAASSWGSAPSPYDTASTLSNLLAASAAGRPASDPATVGGGGCDELTPLAPRRTTSAGDDTADAVGGGGDAGGGKPWAPGSPPDVVLRPDQQMQSPAQLQPPLQLDVPPSRASVRPHVGHSQSVKLVSRKASGGGGGAEGTARVVQRASTSTERSVGSAGSANGGWMAVAGGSGGTGAGGGSGGGGGGGRSVSFLAAAAGDGVQSSAGMKVGGGGRPPAAPSAVEAGEAREGESLAEEYARTALAHLNLHEAW